MANEMTSLDLQLREALAGEDMTAFQALNEEWIATFFTLEARDREVLGNPESHVLGVGGHVYFADVEGETVGCVALIPKVGSETGVYELSKMAVTPRLRGRGIGRMLLEHAIREARRLGARSLFLGSSKRLANAVHLYESLGFRHVSPEQLPDIVYARADVFMDLEL